MKGYVKDDSERMWKKRSWLKLSLLSRPLPEGLRKTTKNISQDSSRFEPSTSRVRSRSANRSTATFVPSIIVRAEYCSAQPDRNQSSLIHSAAGLLLPTFTWNWNETICLLFLPWRWGGFSTQAWMPPYVSILRIPQMIWVWRTTVEWYWQGETEELGEKSVPVPLCPPQTPHGLTRARTLASAVRDRRLTTWAMVRPICLLTYRFCSLPPWLYQVKR
jgi:hypothetical protein